MLNDNPNTISTATPFTSKLVSSLAKKCHGYICINDQLNQVVNVKNKQSIKIDAVTEDVFREVYVDLKPYKKYFFYSGALNERYGIYSLIDAFKQLNRKDISLVICGYGKEPEFDDAIAGEKNIFYLGTLASEVCLAFESNSVANINPKQYDPEIDHNLLIYLKLNHNQL